MYDINDSFSHPKNYLTVHRRAHLYGQLYLFANTNLESSPLKIYCRHWSECKQITIPLYTTLINIVTMNKKWFVLNLSNNLIKSYYFSPYKKWAMRHSNKRIQLNISHIHANRSVKKIEEYIDSYFPFLQKGNPANFGVQRWYLRPGFDCVKGGQECKNFVVSG